MGQYIKLFKKLKPAIQGSHVADAVDIFDTTLNKNQQQINQDIKSVVVNPIITTGETIAKISVGGVEKNIKIPNSLNQYWVKGEDNVLTPVNEIELVTLGKFDGHFNEMLLTSDTSFTLKLLNQGQYRFYDWIINADNQLSNSPAKQVLGATYANKFYWDINEDGDEISNKDSIEAVNISKLNSLFGNIDIDEDSTISFSETDDDEVRYFNWIVTEDIDLSNSPEKQVLGANFIDEFKWEQDNTSHTLSPKNQTLLPAFSSTYGIWNFGPYLVGPFNDKHNIITDTHSIEEEDPDGDYDDIRAYNVLTIGRLENLTTTEKESIVGAINELEAKDSFSDLTVSDLLASKLVTNQISSEADENLVISPSTTSAVIIGGESTLDHDVVILIDRENESVKISSPDITFFNEIDTVNPVMRIGSGSIRFGNGTPIDRRLVINNSSIPTGTWTQAQLNAIGLTSAIISKIQSGEFTNFKTNNYSGIIYSSSISSMDIEAFFEFYYHDSGASTKNIIKMTKLQDNNYYFESI